MTQNITIQIGQCGNQIGCRFWDLALREHAFVNKRGVFDESLSSFFRNVDIKSQASAARQEFTELPVGKGDERIRHLKARAILVDTEEGVVNEMMRGPLGSVFDHCQYVTDVSGAGNNWAVGHMFYGAKYRSAISELVRRSAETCDSLESFFVLHSMGGGTGSGLGTAVLSMLADEYKNAHRFVVACYPSADDDVITSPYNCVLAMNQLTEHADCVMPIDNQSLINIVNRVEAGSSNTGSSSNARPSSARNSNSNRASAAAQTNATAITSNAESVSAEKRCARPFDSMNNIVANMLLNLTSSARFDGSLNVDLNEIAMNLVPFPRLHYLLASLSPLYVSEQANVAVRGIEQMFADAFKRDNQLLQCGEPKSSVYLACALMLRGRVQLSDIRRNIDKLRPTLRFVRWNSDGWKTGLCSVAPFGQPYSLLSLANNTCVKDSFAAIHTRFRRLYKRRAHLHHYIQVDGMDAAMFDEAEQSIVGLVAEYKSLEAQYQLNSNSDASDAPGDRIKVFS